MFVLNQFFLILFEEFDIRTSLLENGFKNITPVSGFTFLLNSDKLTFFPYFAGLFSLVYIEKEEGSVVFPLRGVLY